MKGLRATEAYWREAAEVTEAGGSTLTNAAKALTDFGIPSSVRTGLKVDDSWLALGVRRL